MSDGMTGYVVGDAFERMEEIETGSFDVVCLDDAWSRPLRGGEFGVEYPTHPFEETKRVIDECKRVLKEGGWLIADCDDWLLPKLINYIIETWGNAAEDYKEGYRKTGRVTLVSSDGTPDRSTPGQYLSTGGYPVVFAHKGETDRRNTASASQIAQRPTERYGWGSVKPIGPYQKWIEGLTEPDGYVFVPFAGTAPAAIASERLGRDWLAVDCESQAKESFDRRMKSETTTSTQLGDFDV